MKEKLESAIIVLTVFLSIAISIADFLNLLEVYPFLSERIPTLNLLILGIVTSYLVLINQRTSAIQKNSSQINALLRVFKEDDHFSSIILLYGLRGYSKLISDTKVLVERDHALQFWRDCIGGSKHWYAVDYTPSKDSRDSYWGNALSEGIQYERIKAGSTIRRVFVIESERHFEFLRDVMQSQKDMGIEVRWVLKSDLLRYDKISRYASDLQTLDFAIVDDHWLYKGTGEISNKSSRYATAIKDRALLDKADFIFNEAFSMSNYFESQQ